MGAMAGSYKCVWCFDLLERFLECVFVGRVIKCMREGCVCTSECLQGGWVCDQTRVNVCMLMQTKRAYPDHGLLVFVQANVCKGVGV